MDKFIYVNSKDDRDKLITLGFKLMKSDDKSNIYIFANTVHEDFSLANVSNYVTSNTLTF